MLELNMYRGFFFLTVGDGMQERPSILSPSIIYETQLSLCHPKPFYSCPLYSCSCRARSVNYSSQISLERLSCLFLSLSLWTSAAILSSERSRNIYWISLSLFIIILETVIVPFLHLGQGIGYERHGTMFYRVLRVPYICLTVLFLPLYLQGKNINNHFLYSIRYCQIILPNIYLLTVLLDWKYLYACPVSNLWIFLLVLAHQKKKYIHIVKIQVKRNPLMMYPL